MPTMSQHGPLRAAVFYLLLQVQIHFISVGLFSLHSSSAGAFTSNNTASVPVPCLPDQASALLQLKRSFITTNHSVIAFRSWRVGTDCCRWVGIQCGDYDGRVTSLDLGDRGLESGGLDPALFDLTSLKYLNLAWNDFNRSQLPSSGFERLVKLTHLNLSTSSFFGQVPAAINSLTNLVSLDLSTLADFEQLVGGFAMLITNHKNSLTEQNFETLLRNLSNLRELHLGFVDLSSSGTEWCNILAKSCPRLQVLSFPFCSLSGTICGSLSSLHSSLAVIDLQNNQLSGPVPDFLTNFSDLIVLQLQDNNFQGWISPAIFKHKKLVTIDLYGNHEILGHLQNFSADSRLENIDVGQTNFSGTIPASLSNLVYLKKLGLGASGFSGELPLIGNLKSLRELEISGRGIVGSIPSWVANLTSLITLGFYNCGLSGSIPSFVGSLRHLRQLFLCNCGFSGDIQSHISNLTQLQMLMLYSNNFVGTVELSTFFSKLVGLNTLDLSYNNLVVLDGKYNSSLSSFSKFHYIGLGGCNISEFPKFLRHQDELVWLDLSYNRIQGAIPRWAWELWDGIYFLILSNNEFTSVGYEPFLPIKDITVLDLRNNLFEGPIPIPQGSAEALAYSNNMFSSIPSNLSSHLNDAALFWASGNNLSGNLSAPFCGGTNILLLDLSYNNFSGPIPSCLMENVNGIQSLKLRKNQLHGEIPDSSKKGCSFEALDFSSNRIKGQLPRSLVTCKNLEILDVGNNEISDSFPCWMSELPRLQVLVLKSNKFFGQVAQPIQEEKSGCAFPSATIVDLSSNKFFGLLPDDRWFKSLRSMIFSDSSMPLVMDHDVPGVSYTYKYTTAITYKGHDTTFAQILTALVFIDFSNNAFNGSIPTAIGELGLLHGLNISHNFLTGPIPSQLGHLNELEALDLSFNELSGKIPQELASLDFLSTLNLSYNKLVGSIPVSPHFLTFSSSFEGNDGLCGPPLSKVCNNITMSSVVLSKKKFTDFILFVFAGLGFGVGFAVAIVVAWGIPVRKRS